jgi:hypothetical protein
MALVRTDVSEELSARCVRRLLVTANVPSSLILVTLMSEALSFSETLVLTRATPRNIPEDAILHSHHRENRKSYFVYSVLLWLLTWECITVLREMYVSQQGRIRHIILGTSSWNTRNTLGIFLALPSGLVPGRNNPALYTIRESSSKFVKFTVYWGSGVVKSGRCLPTSRGNVMPRRRKLRRTDCTALHSRKQQTPYTLFTFQLSDAYVCFTEDGSCMILRNVGKHL